MEILILFSTETEMRRNVERTIIQLRITNIFVPGYLGIIVTRQKQFCCIFAATKDKFDYFLMKLFHSSTLHTYHHNSSLFLNRHKNIHVYILQLCPFLEL